MSTMCPDFDIDRSKLQSVRRKRGGFALVTAIFLLLLIATLTALVASFSTSQNIMSTQDFQGAKAYQAARAGMEWGAYQALLGAGCASSTTTNLSFPGLDDFAVTVVRAPSGASPYTEDGAAVSICQVTSTAKSTGAVGDTYYIERQLQVTF